MTARKCLNLGAFDSPSIRSAEPVDFNMTGNANPSSQHRGRNPEVRDTETSLPSWPPGCVRVRRSINGWLARGTLGGLSVEFVALEEHQTNGGCGSLPAPTWTG